MLINGRHQGDSRGSSFWWEGTALLDHAWGNAGPLHGPEWNQRFATSQYDIVFVPFVEAKANNYINAAMEQSTS